MLLWGDDSVRCSVVSFYESKSDSCVYSDDGFTINLSSFKAAAAVLSSSFSPHTHPMQSLCIPCTGLATAQLL